jgi:predicted hydrocarbon binding protein
MIFEGFREIIGLPAMEILFGQRAISNSTRSAYRFNFADIAALKTRLQQTYGLQGAQGLTLRAGRASFRYWLRAYGPQSQITELEFRLLPTRKRLRKGLETLARTLYEECGVPVQIREEKSAWLWEMSRCLECEGEAEACTRCSFTVGLLQEYLSWASGGRFYPVAEVACVSAGQQSCVIEVSQQPID